MGLSIPAVRLSITRERKTEGFHSKHLSVPFKQAMIVQEELELRVAVRYIVSEYYFVIVVIESEFEAESIELVLWHSLWFSPWIKRDILHACIGRGNQIQVQCH